MFGLGTIINVTAIVAGGVMGLLFGKKLTERYQSNLMMASALCVLFIGVSGCMEQMLKLTENGLSSSGSMMMIACFAVGALLGEWIDLDTKMERFGEWLKEKTKSDGDNAFVDAFVTASLTVCIGAMAVVGSIRDGIYGDYSILTAKAVLDMIIVAIMTASMGKGCIFSAIPVGMFQGVMTLLSKVIEPFLTDEGLADMSLTGSVLIFCVGVNLIWGKKVKVANLLPALVGVKLRSFLWTTALGIIPGALVFTSIGVGVGEVFDRGETPDLSLLWAPQVLGPLLGLAALAALPMVIRAIRGRREI